MNRVLMIAYHFPPIQGSSGVHRTVQFARHLPKFGWEPLIVSVHPRAYPSVNSDWFGGLPENTVIERAFALDSARHLSVKRRYLGLTALPDRWVSWWPDGVTKCLRLIKEFKPKALWSTFPVATAHLIGLTVQRLTGLPWIADFRDPMVQPTQPEPGTQRRIYQYLESEIIAHSTTGVFVTPSARHQCARSYPCKVKDYWQLIENGYDEDLFAKAVGSTDIAKDRDPDDPIEFVHSGLLYSRGRNPLPFLNALKSVVRENHTRLHVTLRGCGEEMDVDKKVSDMALDDIVDIKPSVSYTDAIREMEEADALIVFQGVEFNRQIPAKVYEYLRAGHPILALTDESGETARLLDNYNGVYFADLTSPDQIERALIRLICDIQSNSIPRRHSAALAVLSRIAGAEKLAGILDRAVESFLCVYPKRAIGR